MATWPRLLFRPWLTSDFVRKLRRKIKIKIINIFNQYGLIRNGSGILPFESEIFKLDQIQVRNQPTTIS